MSDRTDLFKALNHFMAALATYAPGSHREDVVVEVGDTAFRAFVRALQPQIQGVGTLGGDPGIQVHTPFGRVVIRKRPAKTEVFPCGFRSPEGYACMKHEGHAFEHVVGDAASEETRVSADLKTYSARQSREAQLEREKAAQEHKPCPGCARPGVMHEQPCMRAGEQSTCIHSYWRNCPMCTAAGAMPPIGLAALKEPKTRSGPVTYVGQPCLHSVYGKGVCLLAEGHTPDHDFGSTSVPPEETKPPARAHLKGCTLDTTHEGACYGPSLLAGLAGLKEPKTRAEPTFGVSPRQALGEALACVERAQSLIGGMLAAEAPNSVHAHAVRAGVLLIDVQPELRRAYEAAK